MRVKVVFDKAAEFSWNTISLSCSILNHPGISRELVLLPFQQHRDFYAIHPLEF